MSPAMALAQEWLWMFQGQGKNGFISFGICYGLDIPGGWRLAFLTQMTVQSGPTSAPSRAITHLPVPTASYSSAECSLRNLSPLFSPCPKCIFWAPNSWSFWVTRGQEVIEASGELWDLLLKASMADLISSNFRDSEGRYVFFSPWALKKA